MLPICDVIDELLEALRSHSQVILQAPPGTGKSTLLPLYLLKEASLTGKILMLEPRRLAARNVAGRLAEQLGELPGKTVGYRIRLESCVGPYTRLEVITEGILTQWLQRDPLLEGISLVILDEYHERSVQADLVLTLLLDAQQGLRDDLKIMIMSATLDNQALAAFLPDAPLIHSEGRSFPVVREYVPFANQKPLDEFVASQVYQVITHYPGSLLVFLPGQAEIQRVAERLTDFSLPDTEICPLYGALTFEQQQQAIVPAPSGKRKIVLATNIAETSLTIDGITLVIDSALEKTTLFDARSGITRLITQRISKASMTQRAGRAGRLAPGRCWHLLAKEQAERATDQIEAEILHSDLTDLRLNLLHWGCRDITQLRWLTPPPATALRCADRLLHQLGACDEQGALTAQGKAMAELPCEPRLAAMLLYGKRQGGSALMTAALLAAIIEQPPRSGDSDIVDWLHRAQHHWIKRASQLLHWVGGDKFDKSLIDVSEAGYLLSVGYPDRIARRRGSGENYLLSNGSGAYLDERSVLSASEWLVAPELLQTEAGVSAKILQATALDIDALLKRFPELLQEKTVVEWQESSGTLKTVKRTLLGEIVLRESYQAKPSAEQLKLALLDWLRRQGISALNWSEIAMQLRVRLTRAKEWLPELDWPDVDDNSLLESVEQWLVPSLEGVHNVQALRSINLNEALGRLLDWQQKQRLDRELPVSYRVPTGTILPIHYYLDRPPVLAVRLQEMFGEQESPKIAGGRVTVILELLSPARRPLQITSDLKGFWQGAYSEVKKEMKGRYPKHVWPDNPAEALPTRKTKKYQE